MRKLIACFLLTILSASSAHADDLAASRILKEAGVTGGVVVHVGCGDGRLTAALRTCQSLVVQGLDTDPAKVQAAREHFQSLGLSGQVTAAVFDGKRLPYADNLVNLVVVSDAGGQVPQEEIQRVLAPGGTAIHLPSPATDLPTSDSRLQTFKKPWPADVDRWTHFLHGPDNNAVSSDRIVDSPQSLQWVCDPVYGRHHDRLASVSAMVTDHGRLFTIEDRGPALSMELPADWRLVARDAFNGVTLWQLPIREWESTRTGFRSGPVQLPRRLVAMGDHVYAAMNYGDPLLCLDAATGKTLQSYPGTEGTDEILYEDGTLFLAASDTGGESLVRRVLSLDAATGQRIWESRDAPVGNILPGTLTVSPQRLFFHDGQAVVALDRTDGRVVWRKPLPSVERRPNWLSPTIVFHDGVVVCGDRAVDYPEDWKQHPELISGMLAHGGLALVTALSAEDGAELWNTEASESFHGAVDVFVIDGLVWASQGPARFFFERTRPVLTDELGQGFYIEKVTGRDLRTGDIAKTVDAAEAFTLAHHHRCYRDKATERFIIMGRTGIELISLDGGTSLRHNWTRGMCQYGVMPANGLLYTPPHPCTCYNASKLNGFFAFSSRPAPSMKEAQIQRLTKGPAYASAALPSPDASLPSASDWPTFRSDNARSGLGGSPVPERPALAWSQDLPGRLSSPTSADGNVFVSAVDQHTVFALDLESGEQRWSHVAGGRVDSPPTYWQGRVYFGSADGVIQCLDATSGQLIWRYLVATQPLSMVAWNQLESPWPIAGSVLLREGSVYALAGRSSYLDGGMIFIKLNAATGEQQLTRQIYSRDASTGRQAIDDPDDLYLSGLLYDIPSSAGSSIFLREARLSLDGSMIDVPEPHLYSVGGFLDDTWWHRYYMLFGTRFKNGPGGGLGRSGGAPYGRLLVCDDEYVFGYGEATPNRYHLFRTTKDEAAPSSLSPTAKGRQQRKQGSSGMPTPIWADTKFPVMVRAMALAGSQDQRRLVVAGPPAEALTNLQILRGEAGGRLAIVDAGTGQVQSQLTIDAPPVFDGLCVARGQVIISDTANRVAVYR